MQSRGWSNHRSFLATSIALTCLAPGTLAAAPTGLPEDEAPLVAQSLTAQGSTIVSPLPKTPGAPGEATQPESLDAVTITAQKRREKAQDVPSATTVLTERDLQRAGVRNIQDAAALTPNLVIIDQLRPGIQTVSFRGFTTVQGGQSPFAIVVDGVPQPGQEFLKQQFVDVQQIEFLRGPQGTLYGAGAIAGAINIVTRPPTDQFEARAGFGYYEGNERRYTASVSGPLAPGVAWYRLGVSQDDFEGRILNDYNRNHVDASHEATLNGQLLFKPNGRLTVDVRGNGTSGTNGSLWLVAVPNSAFDDFSTNPNTDITGRDDRMLQTYSVKADYAFDRATLTSITAYNHAEQYLVADGDFSPVPRAGQTWRNNSRSGSQEFRLTSNDAGPLRWNVGYFFERYAVNDITQFGAVQPNGSVIYPIGGDNITNNTQYANALFGQATYDVTDAFSVTGGLRYDRVRASVDYPRTAVDDSHVFSEMQPKLTLAYKLTRDALTYATYSKGFRTGGFNPTTPLAIRLYDNETSKNYELGSLPYALREPAVLLLARDRDRHLPRDHEHPADHRERRRAGGAIRGRELAQDQRGGRLQQDEDRSLRPGTVQRQPHAAGLRPDHEPRGRDAIRGRRRAGGRPRRLPAPRRRLLGSREPGAHVAEELRQRPRLVQPRLARLQRRGRPGRTEPHRRADAGGRRRERARRRHVAQERERAAAGRLRSRGPVLKRPAG